jgi:transposase
VAFDVAKKKHAVAIAEGGWQEEAGFLGDVENSPLPIEKTIKRLATRYDPCISALRQGRRDTGFIAR